MAGACLVIIVLIIPYGVFCRYVLNSAASWPEPMAVLLMIVLSFLSAVVCYREYLHIGVGVLPAFLDEPAKTLSRLVPRDLHARHQPVHAVVGHQAGAGHLVSEPSPSFPIVSVGLAYLPIPIGGALTALFVIERFMTQKFFSEPEPETVSQLSTE